MTFITHPLHRNTEIYIFCRKTHTSSTVGDFFSFRKTTGKIASTLCAPSSQIFYSIKGCRPFMTFGTFPKHRGICINIFCRKALTTSFLCNIICYINIESSLTVLCIMSLDWGAFLFWCNMFLYWDNLLAWYNTFLFWCNIFLYWDNLLAWYNMFSAWCTTPSTPSSLKNILC